jgi:hypothetical protein
MPRNPARGPEPGGVAAGEPVGHTRGGPSTGSSSSSAAARTGAVGVLDPFVLDSLGRARGNRPVTGSAAIRTNSIGDPIAFPFFGPWGLWYPWFTGGFGWNLGYVDYNPWRYGATCWTFGRYGFWYDPYQYFWDPWMWGYGAGTGGSAKAEATTGSVRIKATPAAAKVYIDGALAGLVDEFDGLSDHLEIERGRHVIELRAEGYVTTSKEVTIVPGKTMTFRLSMKKAK